MSSSLSLYDLLSMSVVVFYVLPIALYLLTGDVFHLKALAGYILVSAASEGIKHRLVGTRNPRPPGARDCNLWCNNGSQSGRPGMPSTHAAEVMYMALLYGTYPWVKDTPLAFLAVFVYAGAVIYARYAKRCHTPIQLLTGGLLGSAVAAMAMRFI